MSRRASLPPAERIANPGHHLSFERHKGWVLRLTIFRGPKVVGKRLKFYLKTQSFQDALKGRELVLATLRRLKLTVIVREQRARGNRLVTAAEGCSESDSGPVAEEEGSPALVLPRPDPAEPRLHDENL